MILDVTCCVCYEPIEGKILSIYKDYEKSKVTYVSCEKCYELFKDNWNKKGWKEVKND
jgi:hypothetical protein